MWPKKAEAGKGLSEYNCRIIEKLAKTQKIESEPRLTSDQFYGAGAIMAVVALGILAHMFINQRKQMPPR